MKQQIRLNRDGRERCSAQINSLGRREESGDVGTDSRSSGMVSKSTEYFDGLRSEAGQASDREQEESVIG